MTKKHIIPIPKTDIHWSFTSSSATVWCLRPDEKGFSRREEVDPTPAYMHDLDAIQQGIFAAEFAFEPLEEVPLFVCSYEGTSRTNGWTSTMGNRKEEVLPYIFLSGKRIQPHPGMARYLVVHEYAHCIQYWLERYTGIDYEKLCSTYMETRGYITKPEYYGPGMWHCTPGEIMANDFRILVAGTEINYWPHPGFPHPYKHPHGDTLNRWWVKALNELNSVRHKWPLV